MAKKETKHELEVEAAKSDEREEQAEVAEAIAEVESGNDTQIETGVESDVETGADAPVAAAATDTDADTDADEPSDAAAGTTKAGKRSAKAQREADDEAARKEAAANRDSETKDEAPKPRIVQTPNPKKQHGKAYRTAAELVDRTKLYELPEAVELAKQTAATKFDATIELHINLGVDPRQADQMVRSTVVLPAGTGKKLRIAVLAAADKHAAAKKAGADIVSDGDLIAKIEKGELQFDVIIATPDMMASLSKVARVLGPRGLMPNPKSGTVTANVAQAVEQAKAGRVEFRIDKQAIVHAAIGKASFTPEQLADNAKALVDAILKAKPSAAKGTYVKAVSMATSMGPGIKLDVQKVIAAANPKR